MKPNFSRAAVPAGWLVHLLTSTGLVFGLLATLSITQQRFQEALALLLLTIIIDAVDGPLSRLLKVKERIQAFDGALLDNIVDFITWVFLPCFFLIYAQMLPTAAAITAASLILICASYQFCCTDVKDCSSNFKRWPSAWSVTIILLFVWNAPETMVWMALVLCGILSFVPIYYIHPFQKKTLFNNKAFALLCKTGTVVFTASMLWQIYAYPVSPAWVALAQQAALLAYFALCFYQTVLLSRANRTVNCP